MTTDETNGEKRDRRYKSGLTVASDVKDFLYVSLYIYTQSSCEYTPHELIVFGKTF